MQGIERAQPCILVFNTVPGIEEQFKELGTWRLDTVLVMEKNTLEKTPREKGKLGRNKEDHLKTDNQKLIIFNVSTTISTMPTKEEHGKVGNEIK